MDRFQNHPYGSPVTQTPGPLVGRGLTSDVFEYGPDRVVKLFFDWRPREQVECEFMVTRAVHAIGAPVPQALELIQIGGRNAIVFERIDGISMFRTVQRKPWKLFWAARELAELHARMHTHKAPPELPTQREQIERWLAAAKDLSEADKTAARHFAENLPTGNTLCHGDFHPENILYAVKGPIIIDWSAGTRGDPIGDVARTSSLIRWAKIPEGAPAHMRVLIHCFRKIINHVYLERYFQLRPGSRSELAAWEPAQKAGTAAWLAARVK
jgi:aminoglycoside phosphotransferase (APT) family kinase protein